jgi:hypothetical protein
VLAIVERFALFNASCRGIVPVCHWLVFWCIGSFLIGSCSCAASRCARTTFHISSRSAVAPLGNVAINFTLLVGSSRGIGRLSGARFLNKTQAGKHGSAAK